MSSILSVLAVVVLRQGKSGPRYVVRLTMPRAVLWISYRVEDCPTEAEAVARAVRHLAKHQPPKETEGRTADKFFQKLANLTPAVSLDQKPARIRAMWWGRLGEQGQA